MQIYNVRLGHAMNSSSSHSLIFLTGLANPGDDGETRDFGWGNFTLTAEESKRAYLATTLYHNMESIAGPHVARVVASEWAGYALDEDDSDWNPGGIEGNVDHQSVLCFPMDWKGKAIDPQFFREFLAHTLRDDVAILGGNDNADGHELAGQGPDASGGLDQEQESEPWRCRKDPSGWWSLFNRSTGAKLRIDFRKMGVEPERAHAPELVDVKISDYCPIGCAWCYQGSDEHGKHATQATLRSVAKALGEARVFECAIGGGEPTLHPDFDNFVRMLRWEGVNANFTTRRLGWLDDPEKVRAWVGDSGGFAYSAHSANDVISLSRTLKRAGVSEQQTTAQHVMGTVGRNEFQAILAAAAETHVPLTLLGFKDIGRGAGVPPTPHDWWIQDVQDSPLWQVRIDTALAKQYEAAMLAAGVSQYQFTTVEGAFSCYLDAVAGEIAPSSYCGREKYVAWPEPTHRHRQGADDPEINKDTLVRLFQDLEAA